MADGITDLPPELLERINKQIGPFTFNMQRNENYSGEHREWHEPITFPRNCTATAEIIRAVAPMLIAHGRELEKAEVVAWLRRFPVGFDQSEVHEVADQLERGEHRSNQP